MQRTMMLTMSGKNGAPKNRRILPLAGVGLAAVTALGVYWATARHDPKSAVAPDDAVAVRETIGPTVPGPIRLTLLQDQVDQAPRLDDLSLPLLAISPEVYAQSRDNPFRCSAALHANGYCDWQFDPDIARSPAEARWMKAYGYPTTEQREWAAMRNTEAILAEAQRTGSPALWALGLKRQVEEAETADQADRSRVALNRVAGRGRSLYALEQSALAALHVADLTLAESGDPTVRTERTGGVEVLLGGALSQVALASALGDPGAMVRVLQKAPVDLPDVYGRPINEESGAYVAEMIQNAHIELRRNQSLAERGMLTSRAFTLSDVSIRPTPVKQRYRGEAFWTGEP